MKDFILGRHGVLAHIGATLIMIGLLWATQQ